MGLFDIFSRKINRPATRADLEQATTKTIAAVVVALKASEIRMADALNDRLLAQEAKFRKIADEVKKEIAKLRDQIANNSISDEAKATLDRMDAALQVQDDSIPDEPTPGGGA